ncbi:MAG: hypothetical protein LBN27_08920, partial [Prevotellaceae bacterium]|nr:hypothetical protein [Prevotellaceae bacterium]
MSAILLIFTTVFIACDKKEDKIYETIPSSPLPNNTIYGTIADSIFLEHTHIVTYGQSACCSLLGKDTIINHKFCIILPTPPDEFLSPINLPDSFFITGNRNAKILQDIHYCTGIENEKNCYLIGKAKTVRNNSPYLNTFNKAHLTSIY